MDVNWLEVGLVLAGEFVFAIVVAIITRQFSKYLQGQTYSLVVVGVAGVVMIAIPLIGWTSVLYLAACFGVAAIPMGIEYFTRIIAVEKKATVAGLEMLNKE